MIKSPHCQSLKDGFFPSVEIGRLIVYSRRFPSRSMANGMPWLAASVLRGLWSGQGLPKRADHPGEMRRKITDPGNFYSIDGNLFHNRQGACL
jgi:hypothetical protein